MLRASKSRTERVKGRLRDRYLRAQPRAGIIYYRPSFVAHEGVPASMTKRLARHEISRFKLARIATDICAAGHGSAGQLLAVAALCSVRIASKVGDALLIIDAKSERPAK